jgi:hypothetical protein
MFLDSYSKMDGTIGTIQLFPYKSIGSIGTIGWNNTEHYGTIAG